MGCVGAYWKIYSLVNYSTTHMANYYIMVRLKKNMDKDLTKIPVEVIDTTDEAETQEIKIIITPLDKETQIIDL